MGVRPMRAIGALLLLMLAMLGAASARTKAQAVVTAIDAPGAQVFAKSKFSSAAANKASKLGKKNAKSGTQQVVDPPDPNNPDLIRYQIRCKIEPDWPNGCAYIAPATPYPAVSSSDYGIGI